MKRTFMVLLVALALFTLMPPAAAQTVTVDVDELKPSGRLVKITAEIDTVATRYSVGFSLAGYIGESLSTYPISFDYILAAASGSDVDSLAVFLQGSNDETNWTNVDTLSAGLGTASQTYGTMDLNSLKYAYYRGKFTGLGSNTNAVLTWNIYAPRKDGTNP